MAPIPTYSIDLSLSDDATAQEVTCTVNCQETVNGSSTLADYTLTAVAKDADGQSTTLNAVNGVIEYGSLGIGTYTITVTAVCDKDAATVATESIEVTVTI